MRILVLSFLLLAAGLCLTAQPIPPSLGTCDLIPGTPQPSGTSQYLMCPVADPNAPLVIYSHGYVSPVEPVGIPWTQFVLPDGTSIPNLINQLGFAFAATSYPVNGLATTPAIADTLALLERYKVYKGAKNPQKVFIAGVSEGALVATKLLESYPGAFNAGLALCGPIGDFRKQVNHIGDFRAVFDYYFPSIMPGTAVHLPEPLNQWPDIMAKIQAAAGDPKFKQPYNVLSVPTNPSNFAGSAVDLLWYSYFATNNAHSVLQGNPFDNKLRWYSGSNNDFALNFGVKRYAADKLALDNIQATQQTTGKLVRPLVTMHTTGDPIVPYAHMGLYGLKVLLSGSLANYVHLPVFRYGHCSFQTPEILFGFAMMVGKSGGALAVPDEVLDTQEKRAAYRELERLHQQ